MKKELNHKMEDISQKIFKIFFHNLFKQHKNPSSYENAQDRQQVLPVLQEAYRASCDCKQEKESQQPDLRLKNKGAKKRTSQGKRQFRQVFKARNQQVQDDWQEVNKKD